MRKVSVNHVAEAGSVFSDKTVVIFGEWDNDTLEFRSPEFTATMDSQKFWDDLADFSHRICAYVELYSTNQVRIRR